MLPNPVSAEQMQGTRQETICRQLTLSNYTSQRAERHSRNLFYKGDSAQNNSLKRALKSLTSVFVCCSLSVLHCCRCASLLKPLRGHQFCPFTDWVSLHQKAFHQLIFQSFHYHHKEALTVIKNVSKNSITSFLVNVIVTSSLKSPSFP